MNLPHLAKTQARQPETKAHVSETMEVDYQKRIIQGYFATWDMDRIGDTIDQKAFVKTIRERGPRADGGSRIKIDFNHSSIVGVPVKLGYDSTGAYYHGRIDKTRQGDDVLERVRNKSLDMNSFVYDVMDYEPIHNGATQFIDGGYEVTHRRHLKELRLHAVGPVDAACNEAAVITALKAAFWQRAEDQDQLRLLNALKGLRCSVRDWGASFKAERDSREQRLLDTALTALQELRLHVTGDRTETTPDDEQKLLRIMRDFNRDLRRRCG